jgi:DNA polymerase-3 subunit beta
LEGVEKITFPIQTICQGLKQIVDIPIQTTSRPEISGIYFSLRKNLIKMAATDSFRLGEKTIVLKESFPHSLSLILPQKAVKEIINIFGEREGEVNISFSPTQIQFETSAEEISQPRIRFLSRLIDGEYPNYEEILPKSFRTEITLSKNEFLNEIKAASLFSGKINEVRLKINVKEGKIEILSQNPDLGNYRGVLSGKTKGEDLEIVFNWRFLIDGLLNIKSSEVIFEFSGIEGPASLRPVGDDTYLYLLMPIKI